MSQRATYGIVGGGIIGLAVAHGLCQLGLKDIVLFEAEEMLGIQSTGKCAGGARAQFTTPVNIRLSQYSIDAFVNFSARYGLSVDFNQHGYLFLLDNPVDMERFAKNMRLQREMGVDVRAMSPSEIKKLQPHLKVDDLLGGTYCPTDGYGDPHGYLNGYATLCRRHGVKIMTSCRVTGISGADRDHKTVVTSKGAWDVEHLLVAGGAWSGEICRQFGVEIPLQPYKRQIHVTKPFAGVVDPVPLTIDFGCGLYFHRESGGLLLGKADPNEGPSFDQSVNEDFMEVIVGDALNRIPALESAELLRGWAGLYEITPDHHAILGRFDALNEVYYATGFSGHGFMHAPAVGDCMAALMAGRKPPVDISPLSLDRFKTASLVNEFNVF